MSLDHFITDQHVPYFDHAKFKDLDLECINKWLPKIPLKILDSMIKILEDEFGGEFSSMGSLLGAAQHYLSNNKKRFSYLLVDIEVIVQTLQEHYPLYFNLKNTRQGSETDFSGLLSTSKETIKLNMTPNRSITSQQLSALQEPPKPDCKSKETIKLLTTLAIQKLVVKCNCRANACFHNGQYNLALQILRAAGLDPKKLLTKFNP